MKSLHNARRTFTRHAARALPFVVAALAASASLWGQSSRYRPYAPLSLPERATSYSPYSYSDLGAYDLGVRYLKLGNSYRESRHYDLAQTYLKRGLELVRERGSRYWEAVGTEYLGLLYRDMGNRSLALEYLRASEALYRGVVAPGKETSDKALRQIISDAERGISPYLYEPAPYPYTPGVTPYPAAPEQNPAQYSTSPYSTSPAPGVAPYYPSYPAAQTILPYSPAQTALPYSYSPAQSPSSYPYDASARPSDGGERLRSENQRLQDANRQLSKGITDLEDRIRRLETGYPASDLREGVVGLSECRREAEALARYRESVLLSNNFTPIQLESRGARLSEANSRFNGHAVIGYLRKGESVKVDLDVSAGLHAIVADGCTSKARDIDIRIINSRNVVLEKKDIRFAASTVASLTAADGSVQTAQPPAEQRADARVAEERTPNGNTVSGTSATVTTAFEDLRMRPSSREPLAKLTWNVEYPGVHSFLVTMYDCEAEGAYFCFIIGKK